MFSRCICPTYSCLSVRSAQFLENAKQSSYQQLIHNVLGSTRKLWRCIFRQKSNQINEIVRRQHRLPAENFTNRSGRFTSRSNFRTYRPLSIYKLTARWCSHPLSNFMRAETLKRFYIGGSGPLIGFVGFALAKKPSLLTEYEELEGVSYLIRDTFSSLQLNSGELNDDMAISLSKVNLSDLHIGELIATGCNAAIYSARLSTADLECPKHVNEKDVFSEEFVTAEKEINDFKINDKMKLLESDQNDMIYNSQFFVPHSEGGPDITSNTIPVQDLSLEKGSFGDYNLAVKVMFNYSAQSNAYAIWNEMHKEMLPSRVEFLFDDTLKHKVRKKKLPPHRNIVEMYSAFADQLPLLPDAVKCYPLALPQRLLDDGCGRNMTLFLVMKRYNCCLKQYLQSHSVTPEASLLLFTQLLEALVHLIQYGVTHRDLKSDNILIDLSEGTCCPRLAITDFGCCLESLSLHYTSSEIPKGGNLSLMPPEVLNAESGRFSVVDYSRADLWAAGAIAYEIFGGSNPFYSDACSRSLHSSSYKVEDLPLFPEKAPKAIQKLVRNMLHTDPKQRPRQSLAASVCQILLHAPTSLLMDSSDTNLHKKSLKCMFQLAAKTYFEVSLTKAHLPVKLELARTFCSRIQYLEVLEAWKYIVDL